MELKMYKGLLLNMLAADVIIIDTDIFVAVRKTIINDIIILYGMMTRIYY